MTIVLSEAQALNYTESTSLERELRMSLFREGCWLGFREAMGYPVKGETANSMRERLDADKDWSTGYEAGRFAGEQLMAKYKETLQ